MFSSCATEQIEEKDVNGSETEQEQAKNVYCAFDEVRKKTLEQNPHLKNVIEQSNKKVAEIINSDEFKRSKNNQITIPLMFNIIKPYFGPDAPEFHTIKRNQILGQVKILNDFYSKKGLETANMPEAFKKVIGTPNIKFVLRKIQRKTIFNYWDVDDKVKHSETDGIDAYKPNKYVNIWVCWLKHYGGQAYWPGEAPSVEDDGIVVDYRRFGIHSKNKQKYNQGKHWFMKWGII